MFYGKRRTVFADWLEKQGATVIVGEEEPRKASRKRLQNSEISGAEHTKEAHDGR